jgi:hypothetical protein
MKTEKRKSVAFKKAILHGTYIFLSLLRLIRSAREYEASIWRLMLLVFGVHAQLKVTGIHTKADYAHSGTRISLHNAVVPL